MVSWAGDGLIVGYDPITKRLKDGLYHFASPGSVDLGGVTRINYPMAAGLSTATYPNRLHATAPFTFVAGDFTANPGKKLSAALYICNANNFPAGHVPTPSEILALGDAETYVYRATVYVVGAQTVTFDFPGWNTGLNQNDKFWLMILPTALVDSNSNWNLSNDVPMAGISVNTFGRAISLWANRTPAAPVITSPVSGSIALPGNEFTITVDPQDPDEVVGADAPRFNLDVNGIQIQYAAVPTVDDPNPEWRDLPYDVTMSEEIGAYRYKAWYIRGSRNFNGLPATSELHALVTNLGCSVIAGGGDLPTDYVPGKGALPSGEWQIRARTFDYGHPYPNLGTNTAEPGPLGINLATTMLTEPAVDTYPAANTSPWSAAVRVSIPSQVPPPVPVSPKDNVAVVENNTVRLAWQYRNTHQPPRPQFRRSVQIRPVSGNHEWSTVFDGYTTDTFVDLLPVMSTPSIPPLELLSDGGFEGGGLDGWGVEVGSTDVLTNVLNSSEAHSGSRYLKVATTGGETSATTLRTFTPSEDYAVVDIDGWIYVPNTGEQPVVTVQAVWYDAEDNPLLPGDFTLYNSPYFVNFMGVISANDEWFRISDLVPYSADTEMSRLERPPGGAVKFVVLVSVSSNQVGGDVPEFRLDDMTVMAEGTLLDPFTITATNNYEWRVQTIDTDAVQSNYSEPARFWVVPAGSSGEVRPVPSNTIEGATLGCGNNRVFVYRRGGRERVAELKNLSHVDWSRVRDDYSTAQVIVSGWDVDCGNLLARLQTWAYELVIIRDNGYSKDRVWEGPITLLTYERDKVTIDAKDVMAYAYRRIIKQRMTDSGTGNGTTVVDRARRVLQNVFAPDDPNVLAYLQVLTRDDDAMQYRSTPAYSRTAYEEIDDMAANSGLDYTCVGRSILLWGTKHRIGTLPEFQDENLGASPIVSEYGMSMSNVYSVSDGNGVHGEATRLTDGEDPIYGLVEMLSSTWATDTPEESGTYTQEGLATVIESFKDFAERSISDRYPPPVVVRVPDNTSLNPNTVVSIQHLVPGVVVPLRSMGTLRSVVASQKLDSVKVVQEAGVETVSITLSPFSRDDATMEEGEIA